MSVQVTNEAERFLDALAAELAVSEARYEQAQRSYSSFGDWLHRKESVVRAFNPQVYVQGSFALGTAIKPLSAEEDYDVDSVCELRSLSTANQSQKELKQLLEKEVRSYHRAQAMAKPVREGRRCWVLDYADGAQFHMDIVPAVPDTARARQLFEARGLSPSWIATAIAITDNERPNYASVDPDWCRSNPKAYGKWFRQRMASEFDLRRRLLAEAARASVEDIPEYRVRTPLQSAIMILKHHRDWRFARDPDNKPISIILTTLAAHSYESERTVGAALVSILTKMDSFIEVRNGAHIIRNPTDPLENFADKWREFPARQAAFYAWLNQARKDFSQLAQYSDTGLIVESIGPSVGRDWATRASRRPGGTGLLRSTSVAPAAGLAFSNQPRVPTDPKGFA